VTGIPDRPLLAPWYRIVGDGERLVLEHAQVVVVLEGAAVRTLLPHLLPLLDGTRTVDDLVARLGVAARPAVDRALQTLARHGVLAEGPPAPDDVRASAHALAAAFDVSPRVAAERLRAGSVGVIGSGPAAAEIARLLHLAGVRHVSSRSWARAAEVDLAVVAPAVDEVDGLLPWNSLALERAVSWLPVRPWDGRCAFAGPLVVPGESCCYECTLLRRAANVDWGEDLVDVESAPVAATADAAVEAAVAAVAAHLALRWLVARDTTIPGVVHAVEVRPALALTTHHVLRVPRCPACSPAERLAAPLPWHEADAA
jgi:bacteriocin biosynthesis cyclodehydratase domain-containing protein